MNLNEGLNRRSFLKGAALMGGAAAFAGMAGCAPQTSASQELSSTSDSAWDKEVDVVIAGAGGGGLAAAVEASAAGCRVRSDEQRHHVQFSSVCRNDSGCLHEAAERGRHR